METVERRRGFHYGSLIVACCCIVSATSVSLAFGCAGIFYTPVCETLGVSRGTFALYATFQSLTSGFSIRFMTPLIERFTLRKVSVVLLIAQVLCYFAMSQFTKVWMFYITGAIMGIVQSIMPSMIATLSINRWFKSNTGFFIGFSSSMTGISGVIMNPIAGSFMEAYGWEKTYILYGVIIALTALPMMMLVFRDGPEDKGLEPYASKKAAKAKKESSDAGVRYDVAIRSKAFALTVMTNMCIGAASNFVPYIASYASSIGMTLTFAATLAGITQLGSLIGKNTLGMIADRSPRIMLTIGSLVACSGLVTMLFFGRYSTAIMWVGAVLFGVIYATATVGNPLVVMGVFGMRDFMNIYGTLAMFTAISGAVTSALWGYIADFFGGDFTIPIILCILLCLAACCTGNLAFNESKKLPREIRQTTM